MELVSCLFSILTDTSVILGILIFCLFRLYAARRSDLPPGPLFRLPIAGNMYAVEPDMRKFLRKYRKKYGDIYSLYLGTKLVIVIAGYEKIKEAFVKNGKVFDERPHHDTIFDTFVKGNGISFARKEIWEEHRKFAIAKLKHLGMGRSILEERIHSEVKVLLKTLAAHSNTPFDPQQTIYVCVSNVICSLAFGGHLNLEDKRVIEMMQRIKKHFENMGSSAIGNFIPGLNKLPGDLFNIKASLQNVDKILEYLREFIDEHLQGYDENEINDFASVFIKEKKRQEAANDEPTTFTAEQLTLVLLDFFAAGTETTSSILLWALVYLVNHPDLQEQLFQDIYNKVGVDNLPSIKDKTKLPFVDAFMMECLRHANLLISSLWHATTHATSLSGYRIPKEAIIIADLESVCRDREIWKDPEVFRPQRFLHEDGSLLTVEEHIPFFLGRRSCLGESLAKMEMFLFFSAIVQNFKISAPLGEDLSLETVDGVFGMTHTPKPFQVLVTQRNKLQF